MSTFFWADTHFNHVGIIGAASSGRAQAAMVSPCSLELQRIAQQITDMTLVWAFLFGLLLGGALTAAWLSRSEGRR